MRCLAMSLAMALAVSGEGAGQIEIEVSEITPAIGDTIVEKVQFVQVEGEVEGTDLEGQFALLGIDISTTTGPQTWDFTIGPPEIEGAGEMRSAIRRRSLVPSRWLRTASREPTTLPVS